MRNTRFMTKEDLIALGYEDAGNGLLRHPFNYRLNFDVERLPDTGGFWRAVERVFREEGEKNKINEIKSALEISTDDN